MFKAVLFVIAKNWKQLKYSSIRERVNKLWYIYVQHNTSPGYRGMDY